MRRALPALLGFLAFFPTGARAHDLWIEPSTFRPAAGAEVTAALRVGQKLNGEPMPRIPPLVDRFVLRSATEEVPAEGEPGADPAGAARVDGPGLYWIGYQSTAFPMSLEARKFEDYLRDEGLERVVELRARAGQSAAPGRERFYRCAKALVEVAGAPRAARERTAAAPLGFTLELVPRKNPLDLRDGGDLPLALLFRGRPAAGVLVVALRKGETGAPVSARTDANGLATLRLPRGGFWLVKAVQMEPAPAGAGVDWESWWASITFELPAGR